MRCLSCGAHNAGLTPDECLDLRWHATAAMWPWPSICKLAVCALYLQTRLQVCTCLARKVRCSCDLAKVKSRLALLHERIASIRCDGLHQLTTHLMCRFDMIGIEDLNVRGMLQNRKLASAMVDTGFSELQRQPECKADPTRRPDHRGRALVPEQQRRSDCSRVLEKLAL